MKAAEKNVKRKAHYDHLELAAGLSGFEIAGLRDRRTGKEYYRNDDGLHERKQ